MSFVHKKPHPSVLNNIINKFKIDKKKALFIGDSEHDYQSAINSNINFCASPAKELRLVGVFNTPSITIQTFP